MTLAPRDSLSRLQRAVLRTLADLEPRWTLTGGGALAGFHLGHRVTRDVDLFFRGQDALGDLGNRTERALEDAGIATERLVTAPGFVQLRASRDGDTVVVDLVADPVAAIAEADDATLDGASIRLDSIHEILVNKLCALLGRAELRDLVDVHAILAAGGDLARATADAPKKDGGFSPVTLAWLLSRYPAARLAKAYGVDPQAAEAMRADLERRMVALARTEAEPR